MIKKALTTIAYLSSFFFLCVESNYACRKDLNTRDIFAESGKPCHLVGDPVNPVNGNMYLARTDYVVHSPDPMELKRYYNSQSPALKYQPFGKGWSSIFTVHLSIEQPGNDPQQICLQDIDGKRICFNEYKPLMLGSEPIKLWSSKENTRLSLLQSPNGYTLKFLDNSSYLFDKKGLLIQRINSEGRSHKLMYGDGRIVVIDDFEYKLTAQIDNLGLVSAVDLPDGNRIVYDYNNHQLISVAYPNGSSIHYSYDPQGNLAGVYDGQQKPVSLWEYDHQQRVVYNRQIRNAGYEDAVFTFAYKNHLTDSYWDFYFKTLVGLPRGGAEEYDFASHKGINYPIEYTIKRFDRGQLIEQQLLEHTHDCNVFPKELKSGVSISTDYDDKGLLRQKKIAHGSTIYEEANYRWNQHRLPEEVKYLGGLTLKFSYDQKQQPQRISSSDGQTEQVWQYTYDDQGLPLTAKAPHNYDNPDAVIQSQYTDKGKLASITNELGHKVTYDEYDPSGNVLRFTDENDVQTRYQYDAMNLPVSITLNDTDQTLLSYDQNNFIHKIISAEGVPTYYDFNYWGDLRSVKDHQGNRYTQKIDPMGNVASKRIYDQTGKLVYQRSDEYDSANRLHHQGDGEGNDLRTYFYKERQVQPEYSVDRKGITHRYIYDGDERLTNVEQISPEGKKFNGLTLTYDVLGYIKSVNTDSYHSTYVRNVWGDITSLKRQGKTEEKYSYNDKGQLQTYQDGKNQQFGYEYDVLNRVMKISVQAEKDTAPKAWLQYFYDQGTYAAGRLSRSERHMPSANKLTAIDNHYDALGHIRAQIYTIDQKEYQTSYTYNKDSQMTVITYPSGLKVNYYYNPAGKVEHITSNNSFSSIASEIEYLPFGPIKSLVYGNQLQLTRDYDLSYRLTKQQIGEIEDHYSYDRVGNIVNSTHKQLPQESKVYTYDLRNRITLMQSATENQSFVHDDGYYNGFMREKVSSINGKIQFSHYNRQLNSYTDDKSHRVDYDKNGNIIQLGEMALSYDALNNIINVNKAGKLIAEYQYSPLNQRVIKVVDGKKTIFIYDQFGKLIEIITPHSITDIIYLDDQPIAQMVNGSTYYFVNHVNTTPMYLLDQQGNESWRANVKPFEIDANGMVEQNLRFPGQYYDEETGFYYNHARFYYPKLAQYLQPETLDVLSGGSFYPYAYADYNPVNVIDITGENPVVVAAVVVGVVKAVWKPIAKLITKHKSKTEEAAKQAEAARQTPKAIAEEAQANATGQICARPSGSGAKWVNDFVDGYRAVSKAEADDIAKHGFRPDPSGRSMQDKWFSKTREGAEKFKRNYSDLDNIVKTKVPKDVYGRSYKHPNIDNTGSGFCVACDDLSRLKVDQ